MKGLYDEDGIDGPFERAIKRAIKADRGAIIGDKAPRRDDPVAHSRAGEKAAGSRPSPAVQQIYGYPFESTDLDDIAKCVTCGQLVDVGGELRAHVGDHNAEKYEE